MTFSKRTLGIASAVLMFGTTLQFLGYITPGWVIFVYTNRMPYNFFHEDLKANYTYEWGMWYYYVCSPLRFEKCETKTFHDEYFNFINGK